MNKGAALTSQPEKIEVERGAWKLDRWIDRQKDFKALADAEYKKAYPDRYFVAFITLTMPRSTAPLHVWPPVVNDTLVFEQPEQVTFDDVMRVAKAAWLIADRIEVTNFYEMRADDFRAFVGDESEWGVIEE